ncbi:MAG: nucleotidyltransferase substrate binding protein [Schwartzia sp.]|nr:nucleotidyltransferase substrate binding protein [Schwartzia sp. (in: firmicutes)]
MKYNLNKRIEEEIIALAKKHHIKKVILFGSRARGDNNERSDIDIAVSGGSFSDFTFDANETTVTLLMFDVVNLDHSISEELKDEITRDGIVLYDEGRDWLMKKYENFIRCLTVLQTAEEEKLSTDEIYRMGIIGQFNLTFELAWKALQATLKLHGAGQTGSPREIFKTAYSIGFLPEDEIWLEMLGKRNEAVHVYDEEEAKRLATLVFEKYIPAFTKLAGILKEKIEEAEI